MGRQLSRPVRTRRPEKQELANSNSSIEAQDHNSYSYGTIICGDARKGCFFERLDVEKAKKNEK